MTTFYYGDKWKARLRNMGIHDAPHDGSAPIPHFMEEEVKEARKTWKQFVAPGLQEWETFFLPHLEDWAYSTFKNNNLSDENSRLQFFSSIMKKYRLDFDENCKKIEYKLKKSLRKISDMMKDHDEKLQFDAILRGSSSDGTKIGPCDEFDFKAKLHADASDPVLMKFYPTMWEVLTVYRQEQDPADDLQVLGHCLHSARLLAIVFRWKNDLLVKVDLTPTVQGGKWKGVRKGDPLFNKIKDQHYFILPGSDKQPPIECQPTLKPDTSYAEQNTLDNMPPLLKDAITLLKILINPCFTPDVCPNSPKGTKPTSYNLKDGCYWALFKNGEDDYDIDDYNIKHIVTAAVDILSNIKKYEYFEIEKKEVKCHKAIRNIYKTLLLGRPTTDSHRFLSLFPQSREKVQVPRDLKTADPQDRKHKYEANTERLETIPDLSLPEYKPVGVYRINQLKSLGQGSYGKVFEAVHSTDYRKVAAKEIILKFKESVNKRLKREAMILSQISSHLNIVKYIDHVELDNHVWIFTELCDDNLNEFCSKSEPPKETKLDMMKQMARAIHHLHTCKPRVAHRDLKPSNILVIIGENNCIKVTDFGLSKHADSSMSSMNTYAGTVAYMAPEVHREQSHDVKVDVFSLGLVFEDFIIVSFRDLKPLQVDGKPLGSWMIDVKNETGRFPPVPINFDITQSAGMKAWNGLISAMLSGEAADRPTMEVVLKELDRVDRLLNEPASTSDNSVQDVSTHFESSGLENQEQLPCVAISTPEQLSGASCTDEKCSDARTTEEQPPGKTEEPAGVIVNYISNVAQFAEPSNPSLVESRLGFLDLEIASRLTEQTFADVGANDIDESQNHNKWLKEIYIEGYLEWKRRMASDSSKEHQRAVNLFRAAYGPFITGQYHVCNGCSTSVTNQYRCLQCLDMDLCARCYAAGVQPEGHEEQHQMIHLEVQCAACHGYIVGSRIHCDQCGVDLCVDCRQSGRYCSHLDPISTHRMKQRKWPFTMRRTVQYLDPALTAPPRSVSVNQENDGAVEGKQEKKLDSHLVTQQLTSACISNDLGFVVQWLSDHHGQAVDVDWRGLVTLALAHGAHDVVDCLLWQSGRVEPPDDGSASDTESDDGATRPHNQRQITTEPSEAAVQVAVATPAAGSGAEALVLVGGHPTPKQISVDCFIHAGLGWQHLATTPERQRSAAVCGVGTDGLVVVGGFSSRKINKHGHCHQYSVATGEWARRADMPTPRSGAGCVSDGRKVWVMGGDVRESGDVVVPSDACEVLDLSTGVWARLPRMLQAVYRPIVCMLDRTVLVLSNNHSANKAAMRAGVRTLQALPCDGGEWSQRRPLPDSVGRTRGASAAACGGRMYVVGGPDRLCEQYDPTTDSWTRLTPPPRVHYYGAVAAMAGGRLVLAGGDKSGYGDVVTSDTVDEYDVHTDTWTTAPYRLPVKVFDHGLVVCRV